MRVIYVLAPIGVGGAPEAVAMYAFCGTDCRRAFRAEECASVDLGGLPGARMRDADEPRDTVAADHCCDQCGGRLD